MISKHAPDFLQWFYLGLTTIGTGLLIHQNCTSETLQTILYILLPLGTGILGRHLGERKLEWVPCALYLGLLPLIFSNHSGNLFLAFLGLAAHLTLSAGGIPALTGTPIFVSLHLFFGIFGIATADKVKISNHWPWYPS